MSFFNDVYAICTKKHNGAFIPEFAAKFLAYQYGVEPKKVLSVLQKPPIYLYADVLPFLSRVFENEYGLPLIWTEGQQDPNSKESYQALKVRATGLLKRYSQWQERANLAGFPYLIGEKNKSNSLHQIINLLRESFFTQVVVIGNNPDKLMGAGEKLALANIPFYLFLIDREEKFIGRLAPQIIKVTSLAFIHDYIYDDRSRNFYLLELDNTLINHHLTQRELAREIDSIVSQSLLS